MSSRNSNSPVRRVVCAGIPRSGSTWLFNVARLILERDIPGGVYGAWLDDYAPGADKPIHVIKLHGPADALLDADVILSSRRDLRDIAASAVLMGWCKSTDEILRFADSALSGHEIWSAHATVELAYEDIVGRPAQCVAAVGSALAVALDEGGYDEILNAVESLQTPTQRADYDPETLLHPGHRRNGGVGYYGSVLTSAAVQAIEQRFGDWLERYGYLAR